MSDIRLFAGILTAFVIASAGMALIIQNKENTSIEKFQYGLDSNEIFYEQNFTSNTTYSQTNIFGSTEYTGEWIQSDIGYTLVSGSILMQYPQLCFKNVLKQNGKYDNIYQINNSVHGIYYVFIRRTNAFLNLGDNIELKIESDGIHLKQYDLLGSLNPDGYDIGFYEDSSIITTDEVEIRTVYDDVLNTVDVYYQGTLIIQATNLNKLTWISTGTFYYAGVASKTEGFTVMALHSKLSKNVIINDNSLVTFLQTLGALLIWNVEEIYLPWIFNIILIKIPELILFIWGLALFRGA